MKTELDKRLELHAKFVEILGSKSVHFNPPASKKITYPAIIYSRNSIKTDMANDHIYRRITSYKVTVIDEDPDSEFINKILELPMCSFDTHYVADNLNHDTFTIYY